tara:strand:+ start:637 stop:855 length:219 start_codon:yes stop_codon:yes gene_type:complete
MEETNVSKKKDKKPWYELGLLNYKDKGSQTVISFLGIELTAPAGLKKPGLVYLSFILINMIVFFVLKSFIAN